ncbi:hypothetical protein H70357_33970 [Paenibacillus sp. FSL H7-0357]|uniref:hypothetical protein n=1 Tax=Paenibacillus sp. FSL H7-0357 TaxID=1536774 RepID=UPI0004F77917|nr:hypothetical protein [Paenibacillus sp. FSL H7-0357]AIQ21134.1 hypothetical protein H70357_33970 [Paenibacillus sp. FSL H7-0357]
MIPLDDVDKCYPLINERAQRFLSEQELKQYLSLPQNEVEHQLKLLLESPIAQFTVVNEVYFRARWAEVFEALQLGDELTLLEVASGDADMVPQVMARTHPNSTYITANMNKSLTTSLLQKTRGLPLHMKVIEEDAAYLENHLPSGSVDLIVFQHAVNDIIQAILCGQAGIDTIHTDWMETLPAMIKLLQQEVASGTLEVHAMQPFITLIHTLLIFLRTDGIIAMNHYMFQLDLDWGYPLDLFENIIPLTRRWLNGIQGCEEIFIPGFDRQWWIFLQKR